MGKKSLGKQLLAGAMAAFLLAGGLPVQAAADYTGDGRALTAESVSEEGKSLEGGISSEEEDLGGQEEPGATESPTPEVTPETSPEVTPEITPEATPEVPPEATPEEVPEAELNENLLARTQNGWAVSEYGSQYYRSGRLLQGGFFDIGSKRYYFDSNGYMKTGWIKVGKYYYYLKMTGLPGIKGAVLTGWQKLSGSYFYLKKTGSIKGAMFAGWQNIGTDRYYFTPDGYPGKRGALNTGWKSIDGEDYYLNESGKPGSLGKMARGFRKIGSKYSFYFVPAGENQGEMLLGWQTIGSSKYYFKKTGAYGLRGAMFVGEQNIGKTRYLFGNDGKLIRKLVTSKKSIRGFLSTALKPVGSTLYIWGGGHDDWTGGDAVRYGLNPNWKTFFKAQKSDYNYTYHRFKYGSGLDCSGFVGWAIYNTMNTKSGQESWTTTSGAYGSLLENRGWGTTKVGASYKNGFQPGDVVGRNGHVWIVLGKASDGSYVIIHSSPQGVKLAGTVTPGGSDKSKAISLAKYYMERYYGGYVSKLPNDGYVGGNSYLGKGTSSLYRFRWNRTGTKSLSDPDGYANKNAEAILYDLLGE